jgi:hypothetical protein
MGDVRLWAGIGDIDGHLLSLPQPQNWPRYLPVVSQGLDRDARPNLERAWFDAEFVIGLTRSLRSRRSGLRSQNNWKRLRSQDHPCRR